MNSRERLLTALNHQEPDRVPYDLGSNQVTGIHVVAYRALRQALDLPPVEPHLSDTIQQLALPDDDLLRRLGADPPESRTAGRWRRTPCRHQSKTSTKDSDEDRESPAPPDARIPRCTASRVHFHTHLHRTLVPNLRWHTRQQRHRRR